MPYRVTVLCSYPKYKQPRTGIAQLGPTSQDGFSLKKELELDHRHPLDRATRHQIKESPLNGLQQKCVDKIRGK